MENLFLGLMSPNWFTDLQVDSDSLQQADATFYVFPKQYYQLLNIFLQFKSYTLPALHILMSRKANKLQNRIVAKIKEIITFTVSEIVQISKKHCFSHFLQVFLRLIQVVA